MAAKGLCDAWVSVREHGPLRRDHKRRASIAFLANPVQVGAFLCLLLDQIMA